MLIRSAILAVTALSVVAGPALAQQRPDTRAMSCERTQALVAQSGALVLTTGQNTYDRYVRNSAQCFSTADVAVRAFVQTQDQSSCQLYRCETVDPVDRRRILGLTN
jgi:hypothetical protein